MKTILSDAESCEEHNASHVYPHRMNNGQVTGLFVPACSRNHGKGMKIEKNKAFWTDHEEVNFPCTLL